MEPFRRKERNVKIAGGKLPNPSYERATLDFYPTPAVATQVLLDRVRFEGSIWECASGDGSISKVLEAAGLKVESSDLRTDGIYGQGGVNFLAATQEVDNIVTNPPYCLAEEFILKAIQSSRKKCAFLLRVAFLESERRYRLYTQYPPEKIIVISRRIPFFAKGQWHKTGSTFAHAWFVWDKQHSGPTTIEWSMY
jgi:hypothetical protein